MGWNCSQCTYLHRYEAQRCQMCGALRTSKAQMREFALGSKRSFDEANETHPTDSRAKITGGSVSVNHDVDRIRSERRSNDGEAASLPSKRLKGNHPNINQNGIHSNHAQGIRGTNPSTFNSNNKTTDVIDLTDSKSPLSSSNGCIPPNALPQTNPATTPTLNPENSSSSTQQRTIKRKVVNPYAKKLSSTSSCRPEKSSLSSNHSTQPLSSCTQSHTATTSSKNNSLGNQNSNHHNSTTAFKGSSNIDSNRNTGYSSATPSKFIMSNQPYSPNTNNGSHVSSTTPNPTSSKPSNINGNSAQYTSRTTAQKLSQPQQLPRSNVRNPYAKKRQQTNQTAQTQHQNSTFVSKPSSTHASTSSSTSIALGTAGELNSTQHNVGQQSQYNQKQHQSSHPSNTVKMTRNPYKRKLLSISNQDNSNSVNSCPPSSSISTANAATITTTSATIHKDSDRNRSTAQTTNSLDIPSNVYNNTSHYPNQPQQVQQRLTSPSYFSNSNRMPPHKGPARPGTYHSVHPSQHAPSLRTHTNEQTGTQHCNQHNPQQQTLRFQPKPVFYTHYTINQHVPLSNDADIVNTWIYPHNETYSERDYQVAIAHSAILQNTLVSLPTGLGKTLIAAVVMYNFYRWFPTGKVIFMAPTRPLVSQQIKACYDIMGISPRHTAEMSGKSKPSEREILWEERRVFFCTPQTFEKDLISNRCDASKVVCIIMDEAHKATGKYAYATVVQLVEQSGAKFRTVGLSATPGKDMKTISVIVENLKISKIEARSEEDDDVKKYVHTRQNEVIKIQPTDEMIVINKFFSQLLCPMIDKVKHRCGGPLLRIPNASVTSYNMMMTLNEYRKNGNDGSLIPHFLVTQALLRCREALSGNGMGYCRNKLTVFMREHGTKGLGKVIATSDKFASLWKAVVTSQDTGKNYDERLPDDLKVCNPKLQKLDDILVEHFERARACQKSSRAIVFSQWRDSVEEIVQILTGGSNSSSLIKPAKFVGQSSGSASNADDSITSPTSKRKRNVPKVRGMNQKEQQQVLKDFRDGVYNVLVCTCIGEEGLDIGDCDLIVNYDCLRSPIRMTQRVGRTGRKRDGRVVCLVSEGQEERKLQQSELAIKQLWRALKNYSGFGLVKNIPLLPKAPQIKKQSMKIEPVYHMSQVGGHGHASRHASTTTSERYQKLKHGRKRKPQRSKRSKTSSVDDSWRLTRLQELRRAEEFGECESLDTFSSKKIMLMWHHSISKRKHPRTIGSGMSCSILREILSGHESIPNMERSGEISHKVKSYQRNQRKNQLVNDNIRLDQVRITDNRKRSHVSEIHKAIEEKVDEAAPDVCSISDDDGYDSTLFCFSEGEHEHSFHQMEDNIDEVEAIFGSLSDTEDLEMDEQISTIIFGSPTKEMLESIQWISSYQSILCNKFEDQTNNISMPGDGETSSTNKTAATNNEVNRETSQSKESSVENDEHPVRSALDSGVAECNNSTIPEKTKGINQKMNQMISNEKNISTIDNITRPSVSSEGEKKKESAMDYSTDTNPPIQRFRLQLATQPDSFSDDSSDDSSTATSNQVVQDDENKQSNLSVTVVENHHKDPVTSSSKKLNDKIRYEHTAEVGNDEHSRSTRNNIRGNQLEDGNGYIPINGNDIPISSSCSNKLNDREEVRSQQRSFDNHAKPAFRLQLPTQLDDSFSDDDNDNDSIENNRLDRGTTTYNESKVLEIANDSPKELKKLDNQNEGDISCDGETLSNGLNSTRNHGFRLQLLTQLDDSSSSESEDTEVNSSSRPGNCSNDKIPEVLPERRHDNNGIDEEEIQNAVLSKASSCADNDSVSTNDHCDGDQRKMKSFRLVLPSQSDSTSDSDSSEGYESDEKKSVHEEKEGQSHSLRLGEDNKSILEHDGNDISIDIETPIIVRGKYKRSNSQFESEPQLDHIDDLTDTPISRRKDSECELVDTPTEGNNNQKLNTYRRFRQSLPKHDVISKKSMIEKRTRDFFMDLEAEVDGVDTGDEDEELDNEFTQDSRDGFINDSSQLGYTQDDLDLAIEKMNTAKGGLLHRQVDNEKASRNCFSTPILNRCQIREKSNDLSQATLNSLSSSEKALGQMPFIRSCIQHCKNGGDGRDIERDYRLMKSDENASSTQDD